MSFRINAGNWYWWFYMKTQWKNYFEKFKNFPSFPLAVTDGKRRALRSTEKDIVLSQYLWKWETDLYWQLVAARNVYSCSRESKTHLRKGAPYKTHKTCIKTVDPSPYLKNNINWCFWNIKNECFIYRKYIAGNVFVNLLCNWNHNIFMVTQINYTLC